MHVGGGSAQFTQPLEYLILDLHRLIIESSLISQPAHSLQNLPSDTTPPPLQLSLIALRTRTKLFYCPAAIKGNPELRLKELQWSLKKN